MKKSKQMNRLIISLRDRDNLIDHQELHKIHNNKNYQPHHKQDNQDNKKHKISQHQILNPLHLHLHTLSKDTMLFKSKTDQ